MLRKTIAAVALASAPFTSVLADDDIGCGAGTIIWEGQSGLVPKVLGATTNGIFGNQTFSQCCNDVMLGNTGDHVRVYILRFSSNRNFQDFLRSSFIC